MMKYSRVVFRNSIRFEVSARLIEEHDTVEPTLRMTRSAVDSLGASE